MRAVLFALLLVAVSASSAFAAPAPKKAVIPPAPGWQITGTSSVPLVEPSATHRVEARVLEKSGRFISRLGFSYVSRGDYYNNPGITLEGSYYPVEIFGIEVSATRFIPSLNATADALRRSHGLLPDSERLEYRIFGGGRFAFAYGKFLVEALDTVIHLDLSVALHAGVVITHESVNPGGDLGLSLQLLAYRGILVWTDVSLLMSYESRTNTSFASGPMGTLGVGYLW